MLRLECGELWKRLCHRWILAASQLRKYDAKVKRTHISDGCTVGFGATVMGGAVIERETTLLPLSLVLKEMADLVRYLRGQSRRACKRIGAFLRPLCIRDCRK